MNKVSLPPVLFLLSFIFISTSLSAQNYVASNQIVPSEISTAYRLQKRLSAIYDGYVIEVGTSEYPMKRANPLFKKFGKIYYHKLREGGYSYVIKAEFSDLKSVRRFNNTVIKPKVNEARIYEYDMGKRKLRE